MSRSKRRHIFNKATWRWTIQGDAEEVRVSEIRAKIVTTLEDHKADKPLTPSQIASLVTASEDAVRQRLGNLVENGQIIRVSRGHYVAAKRDDLLSPEPHHNRHNVTKRPKVTT
jgi:DeoR/GlpR family transcriptional regulator of sugar metabolism